VLEGLDFRSDDAVFAIQLTNISAGNENPLVVRGCEVHNRGEGIIVTGPLAPGKEPVGGVALWGNHVSNKAYRGIVIQGALRRVLVAGNVVHNCENAALQVEDLGPNGGPIVFANNTAFDSAFPLRVWQTAASGAAPGQVILAGNLFFEANTADVGCVLREPGEREPRPGPIKALAAGWHFRRNARGLSGGGPDLRFPRAPRAPEAQDGPLL